MTAALTVDEAHLGTPESVWQQSGRIRATAPLLPGPWRRVVVVAPHPDDEILGAGGLIRRLVEGGTPVDVVAVTDGEGSHPGSPAARRIDLPALRAAERTEAVRRLTGLDLRADRVGGPTEATPSPAGLDLRVIRLGLPDGAVADHEDALRTTLSTLLEPGDACIAPWAAEGHPDHNSAGRAAVAAATERRADLLAYLVWAWHWATPDSIDLPWAACRRLELTRRDGARKRWATSAYLSQIRPLGPDPEDGPVLPDAVVRRSWRRSEIYVVGGGS